MKLLIIIPLFILAGCINPKIMAGSDRQVLIGDVTRHNEVEAFRLADRYCQRYGRRASLVKDTGFDKLYYDCVQ